MEFSEELGQFALENDGLVFVWDEEPDDDICGVVDMLTENYRSHLDNIVEFMLPDLRQMYGEVDADTVKTNLGKPIIDYDNGKVTYVEQSFDAVHIFEFEFLDDAFEELQYFSIDG